MIIRLPIDTKSLYLNIKNDNETGHTATVATPLKQGASIREGLSHIWELPENIHQNSREGIIGQLLSKSRALARITNVFVFDKISVNGSLLSGVPSFCIYIREETDPNNCHYGRLKVHYPMSLHYNDSEVEIDNKLVLKAVSAELHDYAFIVEAFEYDDENGVFNFDATIVGENGIPYSKVFINRRGVGNKFSTVFNEDADSYDSEIIALREKRGYDSVGPENFCEVMQFDRDKAIAIVREQLDARGAKNIRILADEYPYALYDIQYTFDGEKRYVIVRHTATKQVYFNLQTNKIAFCNDFSTIAKVMLVTDIEGMPQICSFSISELNQMSKIINSIGYRKSED